MNYCLFGLRSVFNRYRRVVFILPSHYKWLSPGYVIAFGLLYGSVIALGKYGAQSGIAPAALVFWQMLVSGLMLLGLSVAKGQRAHLTPRYLRYYFIGGFCGNAFPTTLAFMAADKLGAAVAGIVFPLSPLFTYLFAVILKMDAPNKRKISGLSLGLIGAACIILPPVFVTDAIHFDADSTLWLGLCLSIPVVLAVGNIYRSRDWPEGSGSLPLAAGMLLSTAVMMLPILLITDQFYIPDFSTQRPDWIFALSSLLSFVGFIAYFESQRISGPVYFSQVSYFIALTTMVLGIFVFKESLDWNIWTAAALIFMGLFLVNKSSTTPGKRVVFND